MTLDTLFSLSKLLEWLYPVIVWNEIPNAHQVKIEDSFVFWRRYHFILIAITRDWFSTSWAFNMKFGKVIRKAIAACP